MKRTQSTVFSTTVARVTPTDLHLAACVYPVLIALAKERQTMTYKQLVDTLKVRNAADQIAQNMTAVRCGRILGVIYRFAELNGLPRISALIVKSGGSKEKQGDCGAGLSHLDCVAERESCYDFDWVNGYPLFTDYIKSEGDAIKRLVNKRGFTKTQSENICWAYLLSNKSKLAAKAREALDSLIEAVCRGVPVETAFQPYRLA